MVYAVIMAGGKGTRFWPKSTEAKPKQFLNLFGEKTMLQNTVERISDYIPLERNIIVTNEQYRSLVEEQLPELPEKNIIGEPVGRDTAPCIAVAAALLEEKDPDATMVVLPADHYIQDREQFISILQTATSQAETDKNLVTIGIRPTRPETGYGYIQFNKGESREVEGNPVHEVKNFTEKPEPDKARDFLESGEYLWNSGMFIWKASTILKQVKQHLPDIHQHVKKLKKNMGEDQQASINTFYHNCPSISIDYGVMEKADTVYVIPGSFGWNDVGSWNAVHELEEKDRNGNAVNADLALLHNAHDNYVFSESDRVISLVGIEQVAVVETEKAILVCDLNQAQGVKDIVNALRENKELNEYL